MSLVTGVNDKLGLNRTSPRRILLENNVQDSPEAAEEFRPSPADRSSERDSAIKTAFLEKRFETSTRAPVLDQLDVSVSKIVLRPPVESLD